MSHEFSSESLRSRFAFDEAQPRLYEFWQQQGYFDADPDTDRPPFSMVIPPPNVTGALHLGHALNNTLQDIIIRMKRMQGFETLWMPGTDHAGIATQAVVERRLKEEENKTRHDLGREKLVQRIWDWKSQYETRILGQLKQLGCSCDWRRTRFTFDEICAKAVRWTFFDLFQKGLIYRGKRLVNWDSFLQTAVSDDEVFHEEVKGHFWHIQYPVINPEPGEPAFVTVATTRPETMYGDTAVAVHPDPAAALNQVESDLRDKLTRASLKEQGEIQRQIDDLLTRRESMLPQLQKLSEMARKGRKLLLPLAEREIPLVADVWAKPELGSGCVKITPAHDANDYEVGLRQNLPMINLLNPDGTLNSHAGAHQGLHVKQARTQVVAALEQRGLLPLVEDRIIELALSDRSKTPIEPYLADQWFVKMDQLAQSAMDAVTDGRVKIFPERYSGSYLSWLGEKRDWPISRQLWWGHQIPVWSKSATSESECEQLTTQVQFICQGHEGSSAVWTEKGNTNATIHVCLQSDLTDVIAAIEGFGFVRSEDVLDTWFSSGIWTHSTMGWPDRNPLLERFYPTSTLITSRDILTLWVARMVIMGLNNLHEVPFSEVFIHPKILDGFGETMSKSKGNGIDPLDVIERFGADALRFSMANLTTETQDVRIPVQFECPHCQALIDQTKGNRELPRIKCKKCNGEFSTQWARTEADKALPRGAVVSERFEVGRNFCTKLWNASRFALLNLNGYTPQAVRDEELMIEDRWILSRLATVTEVVTHSLETYAFADGVKVLYEFAWSEFCGFYLEMVKSRLQDPTSRPVAQRILAHTLDALLRLLHPILSFITEEVWQLLGQVAPERGLAKPETAARSVMIAPWPQVVAAHQDAKIEEQFATFQAVLGAVREIRSRQSIPSKSEMEFRLRCEVGTAELLKSMFPYFGSMALATCTQSGPNVVPTTTNATITLPGIDVYVDLTGFIDVEAEIARNEALASRLLDQIKRKEAKLASPDFVDRAPADIVQRERSSLKELQDNLVSVQSTLQAMRKP